MILSSPVITSRLKTYGKSSQRYARKQGVKDFTFHDFRHVFVTRKRRESHDPIKIMKATGHKTVSMYLRYNTVTEDELKTLNTGQMDTKQNPSTGTHI